MKARLDFAREMELSKVDSGLAEHLSGRNTAFGDVHGFHTSDRVQKIFIEGLFNANLLLNPLDSSWKLHFWSADYAGLIYYIFIFLDSTRVVLHDSQFKRIFI